MAKQPAKGRKTPAKPKNAAQTGAVKTESAKAAKPVIDAIPAEVLKNDAPKPQEKPKDTPSKAAATPAEKPKTAPVEKSKVAPVATPSPAPAQPTQSMGFFPLVLGGLLAGVIGYAIATFTAPKPDTSLADLIAVQSTQIDALEQRIAAIPEVDLSGLEAGQTDLGAGLTDITSRVVALEERPAGTAIVQMDDEVVIAEIDNLRSQIAEMTTAAQTELDGARAAAASIEENAAAAARKAAGRAALARIQTALESGAPIGAPLGDLEEAIGTSAPDALIAVQDGVPTLASLQDAFPDMARAALATARNEGVSGEETTGFGAFLRTQLDVRSTTPQEGDGADAVLSRAEAAVRTGRLADALAEISALPEVARAEMSEWLALAESRADAVAAVDILSTSLSDN